MLCCAQDIVLLHICIVKLTGICNNLLTKDTLSVSETGLLQGLTVWGHYP